MRRIEFVKNFAILIPTYNEREKIGEILDKIPRRIGGHGTRVIIADDGSTDETVNICRAMKAEVIALERNCGVGFATFQGFRRIARMRNIDFVIKLDGDGQHDVSFLSLVADQLLGGADLVTCSRFHPRSDQTHTPADRILLNTMFADAVRKITNWPLTDVRTGFMGMRFEHAQTLARRMIVQRYGVPMEIILRLWHKKPYATVSEIPHPALYGPYVSQKQQEKYAGELLFQRATRLDAAYGALLTVIEDLKITREEILSMHGLAAHTMALAS
jgi:glycosyltransferase involved in cell wall biosynthesis